MSHMVTVKLVSLRTVVVLTVGIASMFVCVPLASAAATSADFHEELNFFPPFCSDARVMEALGRSIGPGPELGEADEISNPCGYGDSIIVDFDPTTNQVHLTPSGANNYQIIDISISNIAFDVAGQTITGLTPISDDLIDVAESGAFTRSTSFTGNSITIGYVIDNPSNPDDRLEFSTGTAIFQVELQEATGIPAAGPWAIGVFLLTLLACGWWLIRRAT